MKYEIGDVVDCWCHNFVGTGVVVGINKTKDGIDRSGYYVVNFDGNDTFIFSNTEMKLNISHRRRMIIEELL